MLREDKRRRDDTIERVQRLRGVPMFLGPERNQGLDIGGLEVRPPNSFPVVRQHSSSPLRPSTDRYRSLRDSSNRKNRASLDQLRIPAGILLQNAKSIDSISQPLRQRTRTSPQPGRNQEQQPLNSTATRPPAIFQAIPNHEAPNPHYTAARQLDYGQTASLSPLRQKTNAANRLTYQQFNSKEALLNIVPYQESR